MTKYGFIYRYFLYSLAVLPLAYFNHLKVSDVFDGFAYFGRYGYPSGEFVPLRSIAFIIFPALVLARFRINSGTLRWMYDFWLFFHITGTLIAYTMGLFSTLALITYLTFGVIFFTFAIVVVERVRFEFAELVTSKVMLKKLFICNFVALMILGALGGFTTQTTSLFDVYDQREYVSSLGFGFGYILNIYFFGAVVPYIAISSIEKSHLHTGFALFFALGAFLISGSKGFIFNAAIIVILSHLPHRFYKNLVPNTFFLMSILALALAPVSGLVLSLFTRRVLILPAQIQYLTTEYYIEHAYNLLAKYTGPILGDRLSLSYEIGHKYFLDKTHANAGVTADGFGNFGFIGIVVIIPLMLFIVKYTDSLARRDKRLIILMFPAIIATLNVSAVSILFYKVIPVVLLRYFWARK